MSFGAFMEGLQGGVKSGQSIRRERQLDDIYDSARRKIKNEETADDIGRKARGLPMGDDSSLGDPLGQKIWDWATGLFGGDEETAAPADPGAELLDEKVERVDSLTPNDGYAVGGPELQYAADGGKLSLEEEERKREQARAERYGATAKQAIPAVGNVVGKTIAAGPKASKGALHGLADIVDAGTDDPIDPGMLGTVGQVAEGAFDYPRAAIGSGLRWAGDKIGGMLSPDAPKQAVPPPAAAPRGVRPGAPPSAVARKPAAPAAAIPAPGAAPAKTPETKVMAPDVIAKIPWDKVDPMTLPKFKTQDWVQYRETAIDQMVMRGGGITIADAMDKVDQQVIGMQQRGTKALLQEALLRVQSGDMKGAGNALVQMFQYVPSGTDAVVGTYNGQLVAQFIDEETGQPVGEPEVIDAKKLNDLWTQYSNPAAWGQMAMDREKLKNEQDRTGLMRDELELRERLLEEVQIPTAQSEADYRALVGQSSIAKALGGSGDSGMKPSDVLSGGKNASEVVGAASMLTDPDGKPVYPQLAEPSYRQQVTSMVQGLLMAYGGQETADRILQAWFLATPEQQQKMLQIAANAGR